MLSLYDSVQLHVIGLSTTRSSAITAPSNGEDEPETKDLTALQQREMEILREKTRRTP